MTWRSLFWRAWLLVGRKRRYRKCLQRIAILERELFPPPAPVYTPPPTQVFRNPYGFRTSEGESTIHRAPGSMLAYRREIEQRAFFGFRPNISKAEWGED